MVRISDITSFTEHRRNLREHLNRIKETGRPLYVTTNGETDAVVLSPGAFDELMEQVELTETLAMIDKSMEDIKTGRVRPLREAMQDIKRELGLKHDQ